MHVHCPGPCCMTRSVLHVRVHSVCPCPCSMSMSILHAMSMFINHVNAAFMLMLHSLPTPPPVWTCRSSLHLISTTNHPTSPTQQQHRCVLYAVHLYTVLCTVPTPYLFHVYRSCFTCCCCYCPFRDTK